MISDRSRPLLLALAVAALTASPLAGRAWAQSAPQPQAQPQAQPQSAAPSADAASPVKKHKRMTLADRFDAANTTHDGHLTMDQARAGMPLAARHFAAMDKDNKGYVTLPDIHAYLKAQRAAHHKASNTTQG